MACVEKTGKSVEEAVAEALKELGASAEEAKVEVLEEGKKGFLGFGHKDAKVRVTVKKEGMQSVEKQADNKAAAANVQEARETKYSLRKVAAREQNPDQLKNQEEYDGRKYVVNNEAIAKAKEFLQQVFAAMKIEVAMEKFIRKSDGSVTFRLHGADMGILIGKHGQTLDSLQYLTNLVANKNAAERVRVIIDVEDYRDRRVETLTRLAVRLADKVKRDGERVALEPMNPHERKIIHMALQGDRKVITLSEGDDPFRHVVIELKK